MAAVGLGVWGLLIVGGVDNILRPIFLQKGINAPIFVLILSILCGIATFGSIGLIIGPVIVALSIQLLKEAKMLNNKNI